jgi:hypothetical protein
MLVALQAAYSAAARNDVAFGPAGQRYPGDEREARIQWARDHLGYQKLNTFLELTVKQTEYLLDVANARTTKLGYAIQQMFTHGCPEVIEHPAEWFAAMQVDPTSRNFWQFRGMQLHQLNRMQMIRLMDVLVARRDGRSRPAPRASFYSGPRLKREKPTLWNH